MSESIKERIRQELISRYPQILAKGGIDREQARGMIREVLDLLVSSPRNSLSEHEKKEIVSDMLDEFIGFGPIQKLIDDPQVTEIMINGFNRIYIEKNGSKELTGVSFGSEGELAAFIYRVLAPTRRRVDESFPYTDVSSSDGMRINIIIPPLAVDGPSITIRKFLRQIRSVEDFVGLGTLDERMAKFLSACIMAKVNMVFSGATGSGKTTTLNVLSSYIGHDERIITIEDTTELKLEQEHVVRLETKEPNIEGKGEITIRDLFKNSLRMRPDRIILGEVRGPEALDVLQAMCSGHRGALTVVHAESPQDVIYRFETMALSAGMPMTLEAIHRQIAAAINLIIQHEQLVDGSRKITKLTQINGMKNGQVILSDIFSFENTGIGSSGKVEGRFVASGAIPVFYNLFSRAGINLGSEIFNQG